MPLDFTRHSLYASPWAKAIAPRYHEGNMALPPEITFDDFRRLVETLQAAIQGMADLAGRVQALEESNQAQYAAALALKENQQQLFEAQKAQQEVNMLLKQSLDQLLRAIGGTTSVQ
jgi:predicted RNA-binding Zn ribbon-like protein